MSGGLTLGAKNAGQRIGAITSRMRMHICVEVLHERAGAKNALLMGKVSI